MIGVGVPGRISPALHAPTFDFNDDTLPLGVAYWTAVARDWWEQRP